MKAERRHELKENDLAHLLDQLSDFMHKNGSRLGLVIAVVVVALAVVGIAVRSRAAALEDAWQRKRSLSFETAADGQQSLKTLESLVAASTDPVFIMSGLLDEGRHALELAEKAPNPPGEAMNAKAREAYEELLAKFPSNPLAFGAAHAGLATVEENAFALDREPSHKEKAQEHLQAILNRSDLAAMPFYKMATDRLARIDDVFSVTRFAAAPIAPPEEKAESEFQRLPPGVNAKVIPPEQVPARIREAARKRMTQQRDETKDESE